MPYVVQEAREPELFRFITNRNLLWQYDFMLHSVLIALDSMPASAPRITGGFLNSLNHFAVVNLTPCPGALRTDFVHINGSPHEPPHPDVAKAEFLKLVCDMKLLWDRGDDAIQLACYLLWRITWIHPYEEGNGRTARAAAYYILCVKNGFALPGEKTIPQLIRESPDQYYKALRHADETHGAGVVDLAPLQDMLKSLLVRQLQT